LMVGLDLDLNRNGQFFGGDSYVCLYTYMKNGSEEYVIYFWQVNKSHQKSQTGPTGQLYLCAASVYMLPLHSLF
jgi:hypothetical protein